MVRDALVRQGQDEVISSLLSVMDTLMKALDAATEKRDRTQWNKVHDLLTRTATALDDLTIWRK